MSKPANILIFTPKLSPRIEYIFRHCLEKLMDNSIDFTHSIETFISSSLFKMSYADKPLGNEFFIQKYGLLDEVGFNDIEIHVSKWDKVPCFFRVSSESSIPFDIFSAAFYLLSRYEEYQPYVKDKNGAFPVEESLAFKNNFLRMPLVDIWMDKFEVLLMQKFPKINITKESFTTNFVILVKQAYAYKHKSFFRQWVGMVRDLFFFRWLNVLERCQVTLNYKKDPFDTYDQILSRLYKTDFEHRWFFQLGDYSRTNRNISAHSTAYHELIKHISDIAETGLILSKKAIDSPTIIDLEIRRMEKITHKNLSATFLEDPSLGFPDVYLNAQSLGVTHDYSLGYVHQIGWRASTCSSFYFYDLNLEQTTPLQIHSYAIHIEAIRKMPAEIARKEVSLVKNYIKNHKGSLNIIIENTTFTKDLEQYFETLVDMLEG